MKILLVETGRNLNQELLHLLAQQNFDVDVAIDSASARERIQRLHFDLVLLNGVGRSPEMVAFIGQVHQMANPPLVLLLPPELTPSQLLQLTNVVQGKSLQAAVDPPLAQPIAALPSQNPQKLRNPVESLLAVANARSVENTVQEALFAASTVSSPLQAAIQQVWAQSRSLSYERVAYLAETHLRLKQGAIEMLQPMAQTAHKLVGSLGTFGFETASKIASKIEYLLISCPEKPAADTVQYLGLLDSLIEELRAELIGQDERLGLPAISPTAIAAMASVPHSVMVQPLLLVIDSDRELTDSLLQEADTWKMRVAVAATIDEGRSLIQTERPAAVLVDPTLYGTPEGEDLLAELRAEDTQIPVLLFSFKDRSTDRVNALRLGGQMFLPKSATPGQIFRAVTEVLQPAEPLHAKVLAVDDDPLILRVLRSLLEPEGIQLTCLNDATQFWETLRSVQPDLLILDLMMPGICGLDLCRSVRHDFQWNWLPVVFLTAEGGRETAQSVFSAGADDYLAKPIVPEELLLRVLNRLKRSRLLRDRAEIDELTGVANRQHSMKILAQLIQFATDLHYPFCLAVLDLDYFKQINDRYGHAQGDRILHQFGQFLQQKFRSEDIVARWGGEEFIVAMRGITREDSVDRLASILEEWRGQQITTSAGEVLKISFSAGVSQFPIDGATLQTLYRTADTALYQAKHAGRSRVVASGWCSIPSSATGEAADISRRASVTLVHPDPNFAQPLQQTLERRGYGVQWLQSGQEAIDLLQETADSNPALTKIMLLAQQTADLEGLTVLRQLEKVAKSEMRVMVLLDEPALAETARTLGAIEVLVVPYSISVLLQRLRQMLQ